MAVRGLRSVLQPGLYIGIAFLLHAALFLVPLGGIGKQDVQTTRGIRVKVISQVPAYSRSAPAEPQRLPPTAPRNPPPRIDTALPADGGGSAPTSPGYAGNETGGGSGPAGSEGTPGSGPPLSDYDRYLARLRSEGVQGWARDTAQSSKLGWKGTGVDRWGAGGGTGKGIGTGSGSGAGQGQGSESSYLDPRVRMIVTSYPLDTTGNVIENRISNLESRLSRVPYPDRQFRKNEYTSGWWNVYIELQTDRNGTIYRTDVLRPESDGKLERLFVEQVMREIKRWKFDPVEAKIHVDVRFYVE